MSDKNWLLSMFSRQAGSEDEIQSTVLNITKWSAVFAAAVAAIAAALEQVMDGRQLTSGNWTVITVALFTLVVVMFVADVASRAYTTAHASTVPVFPAKPIDAKWVDLNQALPHPAHHGTIDGFRVSEGRVQVLVAEPGGTASWVDFERVVLDTTP